MSDNYPRIPQRYQLTVPFYDDDTSDKRDETNRAIERTVNSLPFLGVATSDGTSIPTPPSPSVGQLWSDGSDEKLKVWNGTTFETIANWGSWDAYTPSWTGTTTNPVIGNGSLTGRYTTMGSHVTVYVKMTAGTTTTFGSGAWIISLPVTLQSTMGTVPSVLAFYQDISPSAIYLGQGYVAGTTTVVYGITAASGALSFAGPTVPFTWSAAAADTFSLWIQGEIA